MHHQWARQEFSPVRLSACKASILLRKTARAVVRRARRTLFTPHFRSRSIVAPAHKPATIFSDQSPRDEHERLREVRVRPEGNGAAKKPQHLLRLFLVHHRGLSRALYFLRTDIIERMVFRKLPKLKIAPSRSTQLYVDRFILS